jgi:hypothetical protein
MDGRAYGRVVHRPDAIVFTDDSKGAVIRLTWDGGTTGEVVYAHHRGYIPGPSRPQTKSNRRKRRERRAQSRAGRR